MDDARTGPVVRHPLVTVAILLVLVAFGFGFMPHTEDGYACGSAFVGSSETGAGRTVAEIESAFGADNSAARAACQDARQISMRVTLWLFGGAAAALLGEWVQAATTKRQRSGS